MKECRIYHTGMGVKANGKVKDNHVFLVEKDGELLLPQELWCAKEECRGGLIQFEADEKWGFADIYTGEIKIQPRWDYAGPFYGKYAHAAINVQVETSYTYTQPLISEGGKHGYIDSNGNVVIPIKYEDAGDISEVEFYHNETYRFSVKQNGKWGIIDCLDNILIPFKFDFIKSGMCSGLFITGIGNCPEIKYGVYSRDYNELIPPVLDQPPQLIQYSKESYPKSISYYFIKKGRKFGVLSSDGRMISDITLAKKDAVALIKKLSGF